MEHIALYRKYRPTSFLDVIGQNHITQTLINQIEKERVSHAYLFTGSRGTGKTTTAKIFARAVNCLTPVKGSPCGKCEVCKALEDVSNMDILEIDAASNNKVDEVREIRERAKYPPIHGKYKVYIVDEVHMLTDSAFNALLKTLEEPPPHVIFILATTEAHKLPATILSRCMRFDFHLVSQNLLSQNIANIFKKEGKKFDDDAVERIAAAGEGSVRDSLSVADICINFSSSKLTLSDVLCVLGAADKETIIILFNAISAENLGETLKLINELAGLGKSINQLAKELVSYARDILSVKSGCENLVNDTKENIEKLRLISETFSADYLVTFMQIFSSIDADLRYALNPRMVLETTALRAAKLKSSDYSALEERLERLERKIDQSIAGIVRAPTISHSETVTPEILNAKNVWGKLVTYFRTHESMRLYTLLGDQSDIEIEDNNLIIHASEDNFLSFSDESTITAITRALLSEGINLTVLVDKKKEAVDMDSEIMKIKKLMGDAQLNIKK